MAKESDRNDRKELIGVVRAKTGDKSIKVVYEYKIPHPLYKKEIRRKTTVHVHDEKKPAASHQSQRTPSQLPSLCAGALPRLNRSDESHWQ